VEFPVLDVFLDVLVNRVAMFKRAADERFGKEAFLGFLGGGWRKVNRLSPVGRAFVVGNGGGALGVPKLAERPLQIFRRTQVVLKQKLNGPLAGFASFAHKSASTCRTR
jgi:hypothetical protein